MTSTTALTRSFLTEAACEAFLTAWKADRARGIFHNNNAHGAAFVAAKGDRSIAQAGTAQALAMIEVAQG